MAGGYRNLSSNRLHLKRHDTDTEDPGKVCQVSQVKAAAVLMALLDTPRLTHLSWCRSGVTLQIILTLNFDLSCTSLPRSMKARDGVQRATSRL